MPFGKNFVEVPTHQGLMLCRGAVLCKARPPPTRCQQHPLPLYDNQKYLHTLSNVPWGTKLPLTKSQGFRPSFVFINYLGELTSRQLLNTSACITEISLV